MVMTVVNQTTTPGGLEHEFLFFHILGIIIPTDELIFFRGVETTNQTPMFDERESRHDKFF